MTLDAKVFKERIRGVMLREIGLSSAAADDVTFHMTDWLDDLVSFSGFCAEPDKWKDEEIKDILLSFLIHVPNHVAAASRLLTGFPVTDVFGVGSIEDGSDEP